MLPPPPAVPVSDLPVQGTSRPITAPPAYLPGDEEGDGETGGEATGTDAPPAYDQGTFFLDGDKEKGPGSPSPPSDDETNV